MTKILILTLIILSSSLAAAAQRQKTQPVDDPAPTPVRSSRTTAPDESKRLLLTNTRLEATLTDSLDVRRSKVGDEVVLKTTRSIKQNGEVVIPKDSRLIGRVTEVRQKGQGNAGSSLGLLFERVEGKGLSAPITASIVSIIDARTAVSAVDTAMVDMSGASTTSTNVSRGGSGGGLLGGVGSTVSGVVNGATQTVSSVGGTAMNTTGSTLGTVGGSLRGIQLTQSAQGAANGSAMLTANNKNLKVEKGVTFDLLVSGSTQH